MLLPYKRLCVSFIENWRESPRISVEEETAFPEVRGNGKDVPIPKSQFPSPNSHSRPVSISTELQDQIRYRQWH